jgi:cell wall-associated NlpC family hydrolase
MRRLTWLSAIVLLGLLSACAGNPQKGGYGAGPETYGTGAGSDAARHAASFAKDMVGKPYRYGGNTPAGFDCSGLVHYSYSRAGFNVPRTTRTQLKAGEPVERNALRIGDLVFFDQEGRKFSHVGIYIGERRFVHAPSSGKRVRIDSLEKDYWRKHFVAARRL